MIEQTGNALDFFAFYSASKVGKTGLTVTCDIYKQDGTAVVTGGSAAAVGGGLYRYTLASGSNTAEGELLAIFKTTDTTVDQQHIPAMWAIQKAGVEHLDADTSSRAAAADYTAARAAKLDNLDAAVSTRLAAGSYTAPPSAAAVAQAVWDVLTSAITTAGSIGKLLKDNIDAAISSRLAGASYTAPPSAAANAAAVWDEPTASHTATGSTGKALTDAGAGTSPTAIATQVWAEQVTDHTTPGTMGQKMGVLATGSITVVAPVEPSGLLRLRRGYDYFAADNQQIDYTDDSGTWPDLTGATVALSLGGMTVAGTILVASGVGKQIRFQPTAANTTAIGSSGRLTYVVSATLSNGHKVPLTAGVALVS